MTCSPVVRMALAAAVAAAAMSAAPAAQAPGESAPTAVPSKKATDPPQNMRLGFGVSLVLGDMKVTGAQDSVPFSARKALADVKDFLPYKEYRLLDSQWVLCCGAMPVMTRLKGPDQREYSVDLYVNRGGPKFDVLSVRFVLSDVAAVEKVEKADVFAPTTPAAEGSGKPPARRDVPKIAMDASFQMVINETVVVGTSRLKGGDSALIAIVTAMPQRTAKER